MNLKDSVDQVADFLWDLVTSDPGDSVQQFTSDPSQFMADHGHDGLTADDLDAAFGRLADRLPAEQFAQVAPVRMATQGFAASGPVGPQAAPLLGSSSGMHASMAAHAAVAPRPQVVRQVEQRVTQVRETPTEVQHVTQQHHNVTNNHYLREGDTVVDNRTVTEINARGDVDFDQRIDTRTVVATKGGVAVDGDVEDSAINTGKNTGVLAGDDVELEDSIVGDGNTQLNDSEVGAFSGRGNATNITGENVNTGSGDLTSVRAGGDAQVADGNGNRFSGDTDVEFDRVDGPANVIVGDENAQQGQEDNSTRAEDSFNTDASTEGSHNTAVEDSGNRVSTRQRQRAHPRGGQLQPLRRGQRHQHPAGRRSAGGRRLAERPTHGWPAGERAGARRQPARRPGAGRQPARRSPARRPGDGQRRPRRRRPRPEPDPQPARRVRRSRLRRHLSPGHRDRDPGRRRNLIRHLRGARHVRAPLTAVPALRTAWCGARGPPGADPLGPSGRRPAANGGSGIGIGGRPDSVNP